MRWARLRGASNGVRIEGDPTFDLTVRRWTTEDLDAARHTTDLAKRNFITLTLDHQHHGIGTGSCGPGPWPQHQLKTAEFRFAVRLSPVYGSGTERSGPPGRRAR